MENNKYLAWLRNTKSEMIFLRDVAEKARGFTGEIAGEFAYWYNALELLRRSDNEPEFRYLKRLEIFDWLGCFDFMHRLAEITQIKFDK